jgi:hypothetical protein
MQKVMSCLVRFLNVFSMLTINVKVRSVGAGVGAASPYGSGPTEMMLPLAVTVPQLRIGTRTNIFFWSQISLDYELTQAFYIYNNNI